MRFLRCNRHFTKPQLGYLESIASRKFQLAKVIFSDSALENSRAALNLVDVVPRSSAVDRQTKIEITHLVRMEAAWHDQFCEPASRSPRFGIRVRS
jgi:hypothetical protein